MGNEGSGNLRSRGTKSLKKYMPTQAPNRAKSSYLRSCTNFFLELPQMNGKKTGRGKEGRGKGREGEAS